MACRRLSFVVMPPLLDVNTKAISAPSFRCQIHSEPGCAALRLVRSEAHTLRYDLGLARLPSLQLFLSLENANWGGRFSYHFSSASVQGGQARQGTRGTLPCGRRYDGTFYGLYGWGLTFSASASVQRCGPPPCKTCTTRSFLSCSFIWRCCSFPTKDRGRRSGKMAGASGRTHSNC